MNHQLKAKALWFSSHNESPSKGQTVQVVVMNHQLKAKLGHTVQEVYTFSPNANSHTNAVKPDSTIINFTNDV